MANSITSLTPPERLQLINQFRILAKLDPDHEQEYAEHREIIAHGYTLQYDEVFSEVQEEMNIDECKYVYDVLDLFRVLIRSYDALTDKKGLTADDVAFRGFDGNNEGKRYAFAKHLKEQGLWTETLTANLNSHSMITMSLYPKMLNKFEPIRQEILTSHSGNWLITAEQIKEVIS